MFDLIWIKRNVYITCNHKKNKTITSCYTKSDTFYFASKFLTLKSFLVVMEVQNGLCACHECVFVIGLFFWRVHVLVN